MFTAGLLRENEIKAKDHEEENNRMSSLLRPNQCQFQPW